MEHREIRSADIEEFEAHLRMEEKSPVRTAPNVSRAQDRWRLLFLSGV